MPIPAAPRVRPPSLSRYAVVDDAWTVFGALSVVAFVLCAGYCMWRASTVQTEVSLPVVAVEPTPFAPSPVLGHRSGTPPAPPSLPMADQPVSWQDLTLMLRTGLGDDDIIAALRGKQLISAIGPAQVATLRELGAGAKLLDHLRGRPLYSAPLTLPGVTVSAPAVPVTIASTGMPSAPTAPPVDYAAKDRQIKDLQSRIDAIDVQILQMRDHPDSYRYFGNYNGHGYQTSEESSFKKILDQLDKQRNDLRRQKWQLEGR